MKYLHTPIHQLTKEGKVHFVNAQASVQSADNHMEEKRAAKQREEEKQRRKQERERSWNMKNYKDGQQSARDSSQTHGGESVEDVDKDHLQEEVGHVSKIIWTQMQALVT